MGLSGSKVKEISIFNFQVDDIDGNRVKMETLRGKKAYLVVNVASK